MNLSEDSFKVFAHFLSAPAHTALSAQQFLTNNGITHPPYSPDLVPRNLFLFLSQDEKSSQRKHFADVEEVKQKMAEAIKGIKIEEFKNCFEQCKNISIDVLHQTEGTLKVTDV